MHRNFTYDPKNTYGSLGKVGKVFQGASISMIARNLFFIYRDTKNFDPSEISGVFGEDGNLPGSRSIGFNLKLNF